SLLADSGSHGINRATAVVIAAATAPRPSSCKTEPLRTRAKPNGCAGEPSRNRFDPYPVELVPRTNVHNPHGRETYKEVQFQWALESVSFSSRLVRFSPGRSRRPSRV